ncbi:MAG: protoporphyrinogen oxidase HemJ [Alphaproteobacteria bacterium]|nr:protoporphyrinogen oxidase HemJ [Alphaproteobacteria bacterium]
MEFIQDHYLTIKALHLISVISWMAGLLYLPRLYVYHAGREVGSESSEMLKVMEYKLLRYIMTPAMIATLVFGLLLMSIPGIAAQGWIHVKMALLLLLFGFHGACSKWRKDFAADRNHKTVTFFRYANEFPTLIMVVIVLLAVVKPF